MGRCAVALALGSGTAGSGGGAIMTGRYRVYLPLNSADGGGFRKDRNPRFDDCWSRFVALCASLDRDGLSYEVAFNFAPTAEQCSNAVPGPHALITAEGTPRPRVQRRARVCVIPPALSAEQVQKRLIAAKQALVPIQPPYWIAGQREWRQVRKRQRAIGRIIARIKAQGRDTVNDSDVRRVEAVTGHDWSWAALTIEGLIRIAQREQKAFRPYQPPQPAARLARLVDFAEYAYWRELARLQQERRAA